MISSVSSFLDPFHQLGSLNYSYREEKLVKNPILIGISSNFLHNISTCICIRKNYKNGEFSPSHFWQNLADDPVL